MAMRKEFRPFNVEQAKAGAPYGCLYDEIQCEILRYDTSIFGIYRHKNGVEYDVCKWTMSGDLSSVSRNVHDLVMIPLFRLDHKPVYMGDTLYDANGSPFQVELSHTQSMIDGCSWEAPRAVVETRMTDDEIKAMDAHCGTLKSRSWEEDYRWMINQGIARAIEDGDVVPISTVKEIAEFCQGYGEGGNNSTDLMWSHVERIYLEPK